MKRGNVMEDSFRMIVAKGLGGNWSVLAIGGLCIHAHDLLDSIYEGVDSIEEAIVESDHEKIPSEAGVFLIDGTFSFENNYPDQLDSYIAIHVNEVSPLWTEDKCLFHTGYNKISLDPLKQPISSLVQMIKRAKGKRDD